MLLTGKEDLRVKKTMTSIKAAFEELICEKEYAQITVTELCDRAMVNKKTFYHYYPTLDDLLAEMQLELSATYVERVKDCRLPDDLEQVNREFFLYSASQGLAYEKITCSTGAYSQVRGAMIDSVVAQTWEKSEQFQVLDHFRQVLLMNFINTVSVGAYRQWVEDGKRLPLEEIIELTNRLILQGTKGFFKNLT